MTILYGFLTFYFYFIFSKSASTSTFIFFTVYDEYFVCDHVIYGLV